MTKIRKNAPLISLILFVAVFLIIVMFSYITRQNQIDKIDRVFGIDISAYQGEIDWKELEDQEIAFAFIKATQGHDYVDSEFSRNWSEISDTSIKKGAYLFFEPDSPTDQSLQLFYDTVPVDVRALPPVIDVELDNSQEPKKANIVKSLKEMVDGMSEHYHKKPIIYTNYNTYNTFLSKDFDNVYFWIADLDSSYPELANNEWTFWQYTYRGILNGVGEDITFVDLDLYNGNLKDFKKEFDPTLWELLGFY